MAARLTRAEKKITAARTRYAVPTSAELPEWVDAVLTIIHLLYTTGHTAHSGRDLVRDDFTARALYLARMLHFLLPAEREAAGLLALLLVHDARRATRTHANGRLFRLEQQDRPTRISCTAWDATRNRSRPTRRRWRCPTTPLSRSS